MHLNGDVTYIFMLYLQIYRSLVKLYYKNIKIWKHTEELTDTHTYVHNLMANLKHSTSTYSI